MDPLRKLASRLAWLRTHLFLVAAAPQHHELHPSISHRLSRFALSQSRLQTVPITKEAFEKIKDCSNVRAHPDSGIGWVSRLFS